MNEAFHTPDVRPLSSEQREDIRSLLGSIANDFSGVDEEALTQGQREAYERELVFLQELTDAMNLDTREVE